MNIIRMILRIILCLILLMPILGTLGIFPAPTSDMYSNPDAFAFIDILGKTGYIMYIMAFVFAISIGLIATNRVALASLLILPITVNIVAFHAFLDGGLLTGGAVMGNVLALINIYFLWISREQYRALLDKSTY